MPGQSTTAPPPFRLLGPIEVVFGGRPVALSRRRERCLLAVLLLEAGRPVPTERLVDLLFGTNPPPAVQAALRVHVSRIRRALAEASGDDHVLVRHRAGYAIHVDPDDIDVHQFTGLVARAGRSREPVERSGILRDALALWRGLAGADLPSSFRHRVCGWLDEARLSALELRIEADLANGQHDALVVELADLTERHPGRERLVAVRMLALYRAGRRRDAIDVYRRTVRLFAEEVGLDPGHELQQLHTAILRGAADLTCRPSGQLGSR